MIVGKLTVILGLDSKGFNTGISTATGKTTAFAKATDKTFKAISKAAKIGMIAVGAAFVKGAVDAAKFEKALANVSTMLNKNTMPMMKNFEKGILAMSEAYGESTDALAKGLYDILSASIPAAKALDVLEISAKAAKAGLTDTGVAADAITTLMNSFGDATKDASYYADIMFATVKLGKTTFAELAPVIGNVAKMMETAGGTAEEMAGMLSIMTRNGIQTRVAVTSLRGVVSALIKPSEALTNELDGMTVQADGFRAVMDKIGSLPATDLAEMFPNIRALTGVVVAAGSLGEEVDKINALMAEGSPMMVAFDKNMATFAATWDRFKATLKATSITIGNELLPKLKEIFEDMIVWFKENRENFADFARDTLEGVRKLVTTIYNLKELLLGAGTAILGLMILSKVTPLMVSFGVATSVSMGPVGLIAIAIGVLVAAFFKLKKSMRDTQEESLLIERAEKGLLTSTEEYNDAIEAQKNVIHELQTLGLGGVRGEEQRIKVMVHNAGIQEQLEKDELKRAQDKADQNAKDFQDKIAKNAASNASEAEKAAQKRQLDAEEKQRLADLESDKKTAAEAEAKRAQDKIDNYAKFQLELFKATATEMELWEVEKLRLEDLGATQEEILEWYAVKFPEGLEVAKTALDTFFDKWKEEFAKVKEVFTMVYSALTGVTNQYFANMFSKLDNESATRKKKARDTITDEDKLAAALTKIDEDIAKKKYDIEKKQFNVNKALNIAEAAMNIATAVTAAIPNVFLMALIGTLGAVQVGLIASQKPPAPPAFIRGGMIDGMIDGGAVRGNPGIDTNNVALTNREYVMPPQQSMDNFEELEAMRSGENGKNITIVPAQVDLIMNDRKMGEAIIEFMTDESDRGGFRLNPKILGALT